MTLGAAALFSKLDLNLKYSDKKLKHRQALFSNRARYDVIDFLAQDNKLQSSELLRNDS